MISVKNARSRNDCYQFLFLIKIGLSPYLLGANDNFASEEIRMKTKLFYIFLMTFITQSASAVKIEYKYDDDEEEHHTRAIVMLEKNDTNPEKPSIEKDYNRFCAAILKGANENMKRSIEIKGITDGHLSYVRALMKKAYEVAKEREVPFVLSFYGLNEENHNILSTEWAPFQKEVDEFYVNPYEKAFRKMENNPTSYDSD